MYATLSVASYLTAYLLGDRTDATVPSCYHEDKDITKLAMAILSIQRKVYQEFYTQIEGSSESLNDVQKTVYIAFKTDLSNPTVSLSETNGLKVTPEFGNPLYGIVRPEDNSELVARLPFGMGLASCASAIATDMLPIKKVTVEHNITNETLKRKINIAVDLANICFLRKSGSLIENTVDVFKRAYNE